MWNFHIHAASIMLILFTWPLVPVICAKLMRNKTDL